MEETMSEQMEERLKALETEFETGKKMLAELEAREAALRSSLLRISGAVQVLREFVPKTDSVAIPEQTERAVVAAN
jgi:uncharacterized coiled-coil protein SlyX